MIASIVIREWNIEFSRLPHRRYGRGLTPYSQPGTLTFSLLRPKGAFRHRMFMRRLLQILRLQAALQLLPALESAEETLVGGQAVLEGVMMRSPHAWGIAVRKGSGEIVTHSEPLGRPSDKRKWMGWPVVRGVITLGQAMALGFKALRYASNVALEETPVNDEGKTIQLSGWVMAVNVVISLGFFIFMYKFLPLLAATQVKKHWPAFNNDILFNLVDGIIRLALFLGFLYLISRWKDMRRVFEYHGAEHKTVFAFESKDPLETAAVQKYSTFHPRCGTSFLITVMIFSMVIYMFFPVQSFVARFAIRILLLPLIVGVSYEIIRYAAKKRTSLFALMTKPGLWLQRITTKNPDDGQVECAIVALNEAMELEKQHGGELVIA